MVADSWIFTLFSIAFGNRSIAGSSRKSAPLREATLGITGVRRSAAGRVERLREGQLSMNPRMILARLAGVAAIVVAAAGMATAQEGEKQKTAIVGVSGMT
jgi:hypothetical protein